MALRDRIAALLGVSTFQRSNAAQRFAPPDSVVKQVRDAYGGQLSPTPSTQTRWYPRDLESAEYAADTGDLSYAARLMRSARKDGVYAGVLSTRTGGLVRLPKRFRGAEQIVKPLQQGNDETRGIFDEMFPAQELALLAADGVELGVGVAELVPVVGRDFPVMVRLDPEFLSYRWNENQWYYRSIAGMLPITPGDGRWILHMPGGRVSPWQHGLWRAIGRAYVRKEHALMHADNWEAKLANSARVAYAPQAASQAQKESWFRSVMAWGVNSTFGLTPGYEVKLLESNGRGYEAFRQTIEDQNNEFVIAVAGQTVTTDGGTGFSNQDVHKSIRADLIKETADGLAHTINTQGLPQWVIDTFGEKALTPGASVEWDVAPPQDRRAEADALQVTAQAMASLTQSLATHGLRLDAKALAIGFGVPFVDVEAGTDAPLLFDVSLQQAIDLATGRGLRPTENAVRLILERAGVALETQPAGEESPRRLELAPTDVAKFVKVVEGRASQGLPPFGDWRDQLTIFEFAALTSAAGESSVAEAEAEADADAAIEVDNATGDEAVAV